MSHQRVENVWKKLVHESILLAQNSTSMNVLMLQERICASVPTLHNAMEDGVQPMEIVEQIDGRWQGRARIEQQMSDHDHISLVAYDRAGPACIRLHDIVAEKYIFDVWQVHGAEDSRLKCVRFWVVEILEISNGLLFLVL